MAERVRPRARLARQITNRSTIGVIARSSLGFGMAIGMSQGSRPPVTPDTSTSTRLRPPVPVWRRHHDDAEPAIPAPSWAEQITRTVRRAPTSAGTSARRAPAPAPTPADDRPAPTGDRRIDALRRLLLARGDIDSTASPVAAQAPDARVQRDPSARNSPSERAPAAESQIGRRGDTTSGPATAPGELARSFRPEPAESSEIRAVLPRDGSAPRVSPTGGARPRRTKQDPDSFRRMLESRGLIPPTSGDEEPSARPRSSDDAPPDRPDPMIRRWPTERPATDPARPAPRRDGPPSRPQPGTEPAQLRRAPSPGPRSQPQPNQPTDSARSRADSIDGESAQPHGAQDPFGGMIVDTTTGVDRADPSSASTNPPRGDLVRSRALPTVHHQMPAADAFRTTRRSDRSRQLISRSPDEMPAGGSGLAVAPPASGVLRSDATTTTTLERPAPRTRTEHLRSTPDPALAGLAIRSGLPHTQSDRRRPMSRLARAIAEPFTAGDDRAEPFTAGDDRAESLRPSVDLSGADVRPAVKVVEVFQPADTRPAARVQPAAPNVVAKADARADSVLRRQTDTTTVDGLPPATLPARVTRSRRDVASTPSGFVVAGESPRPRLARPGRMGRISDEQPVRLGLQRHSVVGPGPGALQRALADHHPTPATQASPYGSHDSIGNDEPVTKRNTPSVTTVSRTVPGPAPIRPIQRTDDPVQPSPARSERTAEPTRSTDTSRPQDTPDITRRTTQPPTALSPTPTPRDTPDITRRTTQRRVDRPGTDLPRTSPTSSITSPDRTVQRSSDPEQRASEISDVTQRPAPPTTSLGDRFLRELSRQPAARPQPLPEQYRPMAQAITGHHRVMLSVNDASRHALRSVDKVAATTDNVIHLDKPLAPSARAAEVLAHELTHVAHPSPAPRFFDDDVRSPEERQAEQVAKVMARAPLAPNGSISRARSTPNRANPASPEVIRRSAATSTSAGGLSAHALAAQLTGSASSSPAQVVRRSATDRPAPVQRQPDVVRRDVVDGTGADVDSAQTDEDFRAKLDEHFEYLLRRIERRMVFELDRRGGRFWRGI